MKTPYVKVVYRHRSASGQKVLYVSLDGTETDISDVVESVECMILNGDIARGILKIPFIVTHTEENEA